MIRCSIHNNQHFFFVYESDPNIWAIKCKKSSEGCKLRLRACRRKTHGMFEIIKHINPHICVYPILSQDHNQLHSTLIAKETKCNQKRSYHIHCNTS